MRDLVIRKDRLDRKIAMQHLCRPFLFIVLLSLIIPNIASGDISLLSGTESIVSTATWGTDQSQPAIWEDRIVWAHYYPSPEDPYMFNSDILLYNTTSGMLLRTPTSLPYQEKPDIWEDRLVWQSWEDDNYEIHFFNLSTTQERRITSDQVNQVKPKIWNDWIVWQEGVEGESECSVHLYNLQTGNVTKLGDQASSSAKSPAIWGDRIVWEDGRNASMGNFEIYLFNLTSGNETQVTTDPYAQLSPAIWGDRIVWMDNRDISSQIYLYDLSSGNETRLTSGDFYRQSPAIAGDYVVYVNDTVVSLIDLTTMTEYSLSKDTTGSVKHDPNVWGNRIVWADMRNSDFDIYLYTLGTSMPPLIANFTPNLTQGEPLFNVSFTDTSSGQVDGWQWDFGDGTSSTEQNPLHTYDSEGSYTVILTVYNPWQRDAARKLDLISVGSEPVPAFTQNKTSGPAPLVIQFNDKSAGLPTGWIWDFGDGGTAEEQAPVHLYAQPGVYSVNLTVANIFGNASINKPELITVMDGTYFNCIFPSDGLTLSPEGNGTHLDLNTTEAVNCSIDIQDNQTILTCVPEPNSRIGQVNFFAENGSQFVYEGNDVISGTFDKVSVRSCDLSPNNFTQKIGNNSFYNFTLNMDTYYPGGIVHSVAWEGCTPDDFSRFDDIKIMYNYGTIEDLAYTVRFENENLEPSCPTTLVFGVSSDWVEQYGWRWCHSFDSNPSGAAVYVDGEFVGSTPLCIGDGLPPGNHMVLIRISGYYDKIFQISLDDKRDSIHVFRIGDDGSGEVLNTTFIGHDPVRNLDFFRAESPNGLSTFGLAALSKSGNIFQIAQMAAASAVQPSGGGGGGGGSGSRSSWVSENAAAQATTSVPTPAPTPAGTPVTISDSSGDTGPLPSVSPGGTMEPGEAVPQVTSENQGISFLGSLTEGTTTLVILKNLSVVFVVIFITTVFYLRWKKREG